MTNVFRNSDYVKVYDSNRPVPTQGLFDTIKEYLARDIPSTNWNTMIDIGCGSGLSTVGWSKEPFRKVIGFDCSQAQIDLAKKLHSDMRKIDFKVSPAESLPLENSSVDLITCSQSFHYFDMQRFSRESFRVLKPGGVLSLFAYYFPTIKFVNHTTSIISNNGFKLSTENLLQEFHDYYLPDQYKLRLRTELICSKYKTCKDLLTYFTDLELHGDSDQEDEKLTRVLLGTGETLIGVMKSQAMFQQFLDKEPDHAMEFIHDLEEMVKEIGGSNELSRIRVELHYQYFLLLCRKPEY